MMEHKTEEEISMLLSTYMYLNYYESVEGMKIEEVLGNLASHPDYQKGGIHYGEYLILKQASSDPQFANITIQHPSNTLGYDSGTAACTFHDSITDSVYVVYRGTGDGEWQDNGLGLTSAATIQQKRALQYYEEVMQSGDYTKSQRIIVTGHSKGGNKAQFVMMSAKADYRIDSCYSIDGQGFSDETLQNWKTQYGEKEFQDRAARITGIHGENDYVSPLGHSIIPEKNIRYIRTSIQKDHVMGYHDIKYLFAEERMQEDGTCITEYHGYSNAQVVKRGAFGDYAAALSKQVMALPVDERIGSAAVLMQLMEMTQGSSRGINGEKVTIYNVADFMKGGIPVINQVTLKEQEGMTLLNRFATCDTLSMQVPGGMELGVHAQKLFQKGDSLQAVGKRIGHITAEFKDEVEEIPWYLLGRGILQFQAEAICDSLMEIKKKAENLAALQQKIAVLYQSMNGSSDT